MNKSALVRFALIALIPAALTGDAMASSQEQRARLKAQSLAEQTGWEQPLARTSHTHPLGIQTLSVEKQENKKQPDNQRMQVYQYHYDLQKARRLTFDTLNETLMASSDIDSVHLPLNDNEISFAITLAEAQPTLVQQLRDEQSRRGQTPFAQLADLDVKASIFEPLNPAHECHVQRCALLSLFDDTRTVFAVEPVINLQQMSVSTLKGL